MRLALREGVPIVPVIAAGSHETFAILSIAS
jgi:1-acyl-sn-glycerol-3-phosphate acyltransferase